MEDRTNDSEGKFRRRSVLQTVGAAGAGLVGGGMGASTFYTHPTRATISSASTQAKSFEIIDDFEDGNLKEYTFDRGESGVSVTDSVVKNGDVGLKINGTDTEMISTPGGSYELDYYPEAGDTFSCWVYATNGAGRTNFTYGVQNHQNRYFIRVNTYQGHFSIYRYETGTGHLLADTGVTLSEDTWYRVEVDWATDGTHTATLYDADGIQVTQLSATDSTWTSGGIGYDAYLASSGSGSGTMYFDYVTKGRYLIDNFEDGDLSEYSFDKGSSGASLVTSPTYNGSTALAINGTNTEMVSTSGLNTYPEAGDAFRYHVRTTGGAEDVNLTYGVQDHNNRYFIRVDVPNNDLMLFRYENGNFYQLAATDPVLTEDTWYEVGVEWDSDGTHTVRMFKSQDDTQVAQVSATDTTWTSGGIGYDAYLGSTGGTVYFDYITMNCTITGSDARRIIDDFEDGDLEEYEFDRGKSGASIVTNPTRNWKKALAISGTNTEMISTVGLGAYPSQGDIFSFWIRATNNADKINLTYGVQDHQNRYFVRVNFVEDRLQLWRYENGTGTSLVKDVSGYTLSQDTWYEVKVRWETDGDHTVTLLDSDEKQLAQLSATDSTWIEGGIGYDAYLGSSDGTVYFDHITFGTRELPNEVTVTGDTGDGSTVDYELTVNGDIAKGELADNETISNNTASGNVADGSKDSFEFSGEITRFAVPEYLQLKVDRPNQTITVTDLRSSPTTAADYEFTVSGNLTAQSDTESGDSISSGTATGSVTGGQDSYDFTGELLQIKFLGTTITNIDFTERPMSDGELNEAKTTVKNSTQYSAMQSALEDDGFVTDMANAKGVFYHNKDTDEYGDSLSIPVENRGMPCRETVFRTSEDDATNELSMLATSKREGEPRKTHITDSQIVQELSQGVATYRMDGGA